MSSDPRTSALVVRALLDGTVGVPDRNVSLVQQMLGVLGYDFHSAANVARTNDQLVRAKTSGLLEEAAQRLVALEAAFREAHVPPSTREQPFPPASAMKTLRGIGALRQRVTDLGAAILAAETPPTDRVWARLRDERVLLEDLLRADIGLVAGATDLVEAARGLLPTESPALSTVEGPLASVEAAMTARRALLS